MDGINLEKHHALLSSSNVQALCEPLLQLIGITYFNYIKIHHHDGSREILASNPDWLAHFYKHALYNSVGAMEIERHIPRGYVLWSDLNRDDPIYAHGRDLFNIDHGISFVIKRSDVTYLYIFASNRQNEAINKLYTSNIDLLQRFIHYFTDKGRDLIVEASQHRIVLPKQQPKFQPHDVNPNKIDLNMEDIRSRFFTEAPVSRYFLLNESDQLYLTSKRAECALFFARGYTSKQIAKRVGLSYRTVEGYLLDIKNKLHAYSGGRLTRPQMMQMLRYSCLH